MTTTINERVAANKQLNLGKSSTLPFSPQTPQQLSFALENQMTQSMIGLMGPSAQTTGEMMPFMNISTPANTICLIRLMVQGSPTT